MQILCPLALMIDRMRAENSIPSGGEMVKNTAQWNIQNKSEQLCLSLQSSG